MFAFAYADSKPPFNGDTISGMQQCIMHGQYHACRHKSAYTCHCLLLMWNQMLLCSQKEIIPAWGILGCATKGGVGCFQRKRGGGRHRCPFHRAHLNIRGAQAGHWPLAFNSSKTKTMSHTSHMSPIFPWMATYERQTPRRCGLSFKEGRIMFTLSSALRKLYC